jgi:hypothetical protein
MINNLKERNKLLTKRNTAEKHFFNLFYSLSGDEHTAYENMHDIDENDFYGGACDIPTKQLKASKYKDFRILLDYFERND